MMRACGRWIKRLPTPNVTEAKEIADNVRAAVKAGDYASTSEVVREALRDWQLKRASQREQIEHLRRLWEVGLKSGQAGPFDIAEIKPKLGT